MLASSQSFFLRDKESGSRSEGSSIKRLTEIWPVQRLFHKRGRAGVTSCQAALSVFGQSRRSARPCRWKRAGTSADIHSLGRGAPASPRSRDFVKDCLNHVVNVAALSPPKERKMRRWGDHTGAGGRAGEQRRGGASTDHTAGAS